MELGQLTENILKSNDRDKVLRQCRELGFDTLPKEWSYSHLSIEPIWENGERLILEPHFHSLIWFGMYVMIFKPKGFV